MFLATFLWIVPMFGYAVSVTPSKMQDSTKTQGYLNTFDFF